MDNEKIMSLLEKELSRLVTDYVADVDLLMTGKTNTTEQSKDTKLNKDKLKQTKFHSLDGREFVLWYHPMSPSGEIMIHTVKMIQGYMQNFSPANHIVISGEEFGFNIIPYKNLVGMIEVVKE